MPCISSFSTSLGYVQGFCHEGKETVRTILEIRCPKGLEFSADISKISHYPHENEIIVTSLDSFRVEKVEIKNAKEP
eukprot:UN29271